MGCTILLVRFLSLFGEVSPAFNCLQMPYMMRVCITMLVPNATASALRVVGTGSLRALLGWVTGNNPTGSDVQLEAASCVVVVLLVLNNK